MLIATIKSIIRFFIAMSYGFAFYFFTVDERLYALGPKVALLVLLMMALVLIAYALGFTLQPVDSLKRNPTKQYKDSKFIRYFCSIIVFIMIVTTLPSIYGTVGLWVIPLTLFWCGCLLLFIYEGYK